MDGENAINALAYVACNSIASVAQLQACCWGQGKGVGEQMALLPGGIGESGGKGWWIQGPRAAVLSGVYGQLHLDINSGSIRACVLTYVTRSAG